MHRPAKAKATGGSDRMLRRILHELRVHAPFTLLGTVVGIAVAAGFVYGGVPERVSEMFFWTFHPLHVLFSAIVTASLFRMHSRRGALAVLLVGYVGSVGVGTLSDSLIPLLGEALIGLHDPHVHGHAHIGFIEMWWLVNPLALIGVAVGFFRPATKLPHAAHVLLSTAASLFHMVMSIHAGHVAPLTIVLVPVFLFLAVWIPCCTSDIVFPLLFCKDARDGLACRHDHHH